MSIITGGNVISGGRTVLDTGDGQILTVDGVPVDNVDGVASQGTLTIGEPVTDGDTFTIGTQVYQLLDTPLAAYDVNIGADEAATKVNIVAAINASGTPGTEYFAGTLIHPDVSAAAAAVDDCVLSAKTTGVAGDTIATTETFTHISNVFDAATLGTTTSGVDNVDATYFGRVTAGGLVKDNATGRVYENTGTQALPTYTRIDTVG